MARISLLRRLLPSKLPPDQRVTLLTAGSALFIGEFDLQILQLALPQIQASLHVSESQIGLFTAVTRLGVIAAFALAAVADTIGRRNLLLFTIIGMTVATGLTAFAHDAMQFLILQTLARCFAYTEDMLCFVIIAEVVEPDLRGFALSRLAALGTLGAGAASLLFSQINNLPHGWRDFYLMGAAGFAILVIARRNLKETRRFEDLRAQRGKTQSMIAHLRPLVVLAKSYPGRFAALAATTLPSAFGMAAAGALLSKYLQEDRHFAPGDISTLYFCGGAVSMIGYLIAGPLSDRIGRRALLAVATPATAIAYAGIYLAPNTALVGVGWIVAIFFSFAGNVTMSAVASELFPTSHRATASAARALLGTGAGIAGLSVEGLLYDALGSHVQAILYLLACAPIAVIPLLLFIPETANRSLEAIAPETMPLDVGQIPNP